MKKKSERKLKKINKRIVKLSKKVKKLQDKKNKLLAKFKKVKRKPSLKIIKNRKNNIENVVEAKVTTIEPGQTH